MATRGAGEDRQTEHTIPAGASDTGGIAAAGTTPAAVRWTSALWMELVADAVRWEAGRTDTLPETEETEQGTGANATASSAPKSAAKTPGL